MMGLGIPSPRRSSFLLNDSAEGVDGVLGIPVRMFPLIAPYRVCVSHARPDCQMVEVLAFLLSSMSLLQRS